jgi:hypothetical protein
MTILGLANNFAYGTGKLRRAINKNFVIPVWINRNKKEIEK